MVIAKWKQGDNARTKISMNKFLVVLVFAAMASFTFLPNSNHDSSNRTLSHSSKGNNLKNWPNQDKIGVMIQELSQFDPSTVTFPEELAHEYDPATKRNGQQALGPLLRIPLIEMDPNPQLLVNSIAEGDTGHFLHNCAATSGVRIDTSSTPWIMISVDLKGNTKTFGGDEFYITYAFNGDTGSPDAVARVIDRADGTYKIYFLRSRSPRQNAAPNPAAVGALTVNLIYTCGCSFLDPPEKRTWKEDGSINAVWKVESVPPPSFGRFKVEPRRFPELSTAYDFVFAAGNSLMKNFVWKCFPTAANCPFANVSQKDFPVLYRLEGKAGMRPNIVYSNGLGAPLNTRTVYTKFLPRIENGAKLSKESEAVNGVIQEDRSAFILGSCVWDLSSIYDSETFDRYGSNHRFGFHEFGDHLEAIRIYIGEVRKSYPQRQIYWKGCTAVHRHLFPYKEKSNVDAVIYPSLVRGRHLDTAQKVLMEELNVPVIDMFEMTYEMAEFHGPNPTDIMHYNEEMQKYWIDYFIPEDKGKKVNVY